MVSGKNHTVCLRDGNPAGCFERLGGFIDEQGAELLPHQQTIGTACQCAGYHARFTKEGFIDANLQFCSTVFQRVYFLTDVSIVLNGNEVRSLCNVSEVSSERKVRQLFLCVGPTRFISDQNYSYVVRRNLMPVNVGGNSISVDISDIISEYDMLYARLGLQMEGLQECIYSDVIRIK